jgi:hypothetical protein
MGMCIVASEFAGAAISGGLKRKAVDGGAHAAAGPPPIKYNTVGDDADVTWSAPKNQKGDGRSKLNDKFGY